MRNVFVIAAAFAAGSASAQVQITEIYPGITGEDGTNFWFEVTNTSGANFDTGNLFWDDDSPNQLDGSALDSFVLAPGESAVFLIADDLTDVTDTVNFSNTITEFESVWGSVVNVGITNGGGGLSQNGDSVNLSFDGGLSFPISLVFGSGFANSGATIDSTGAPTDSVLGVNGAYQSNSFFNDNIGDVNNQYSLIGSPGTVPAPASVALLGLGGLAAARRRR